MRLFALSFDLFLLGLFVAAFCFTGVFSSIVLICYLILATILLCAVAFYYRFDEKKRSVLTTTGTFIQATIDEVKFTKDSRYMEATKPYNIHCHAYISEMGKEYEFISYQYDFDIKETLKEKGIHAIGFYYDPKNPKRYVDSPPL